MNRIILLSSFILFVCCDRMDDREITVINHTNRKIYCDYWTSFNDFNSHFKKYKKHDEKLKTIFDYYTKTDKNDSLYLSIEMGTWDGIKEGEFALVIIPEDTALKYKDQAIITNINSIIRYPLNIDSLDKWNWRVIIK